MEVVIRPGRTECGRESGRVTGVHEDPGTADDLGQDARRAGHDRHARRDRLERDEAG